MSGMTKRFRWGVSINAMLLRFSTPEIRTLEKDSRKLIAHYTRPDFQGDGCNSSIIAFEKFDHAFVLAYNYNTQEWVLDLDSSMDYPPPTNTKPPRRRRQGGQQRQVQAAASRRRRPPRALLRSLLRIELRKLSRSPFCRALNAFARDVSAMRSVAPEVFWQRAYLLRGDAARERSAATDLIQMFRILGDVQARLDDAVLRRVRPPATLAFIGDTPSYERQADDGLWDIALFGARSGPSERK